MQTLFQYNWQVRKDWFTRCQSVPEEQLLRPRIGGVGGILQTLFHIVDVEYSWIRALKGEPDFDEGFESFNTLDKVEELSRQFHKVVQPFVASWTADMEMLELRVQRNSGKLATYRYGEIMRHVLVHEIHHIGQLSVWSRELGRDPVTANLIRRGLFP